MKDYRVRISIRNERLLSAIEGAGYPSARQCSIANGYPDHKVGTLVSGARKPLDSTTGKPTKFCKEVLEIVGKNIEDCFTPRQLKGFKRNSYQVKVDEKELKQLVSTSNNQEKSLLESELNKKISEVFSKRLTAKQEKVLRLYYGIGCMPETIDTISALVNTSRSRIDQTCKEAICCLNICDLPKSKDASRLNT